MVCLSECNEKSSLFQRFGLWEACLVVCLSVCKKTFSVLSLSEEWAGGDVFRCFVHLKEKDILYPLS